MPAPDLNCQSFNTSHKEVLLRVQGSNNVKIIKENKTPLKGQKLNSALKCSDLEASAKGPVIIYRLGGSGGFWAKHSEI